MDNITVIYEDPLRREYEKLFFEHPNEELGNALRKARAFVRELKKKNEQSPYPLFRNIEIKY